MEENTGVDKVKEIKEGIYSGIENLISATKEKMDSTNILQKELQDAQWYLGEEKAKRQYLENELQGKSRHIEHLEGEMNRLRNELSEARWYLGEERSKREQLEQVLQGCQQRFFDLESQVNNFRSRVEELQQELAKTQWYLGEEKARHQQLDQR